MLVECVYTVGNYEWENEMSDTTGSVLAAEAVQTITKSSYYHEYDTHSITSTSETEVVKVVHVSSTSVHDLAWKWTWVHVDDDVDSSTATFTSTGTQLTVTMLKGDDRVTVFLPLSVVREIAKLNLDGEEL